MTHLALRSIPRRPKLVALVIFLSLGLPAISSRAFAAEPAGGSSQSLKPILDYISSGWNTLTRSMTDCQTVVDPKLVEASVLYLPADFPAPAAVKELQKRCKVQVQALPA